MRRLAKSYLKDPMMAYVGTLDLAVSGSKVSHLNVLTGPFFFFLIQLGTKKFLVKQKCISWEFVHLFLAALFFLESELQVVCVCVSAWDLFTHFLCFSSFQAVNTVQQTVLIVREEEKKSYVFDFIRNMLPEDKVLIFVGKKLVWVEIWSLSKCKRE